MSTFGAPDQFGPGEQPGSPQSVPPQAGYPPQPAPPQAGYPPQGGYPPQSGLGVPPGQPVGGAPPAPGYPPVPQKKSRTALVVTLSAFAVLLLVCVGGVFAGVAVYRNGHHDDGGVGAGRRAGASAEGGADSTPGGLTADGNGLVAGSGPVQVDVYLDFQCPYCQRFESAAGGQLRRYVAEKKITLNLYILSFLDTQSQNHYSSRAANAAVCAAQGGKLLEYTEALYADQPEEGTAGPEDGQLVAAGKPLGLGDDFARCVTGHHYLAWAQTVSSKLQVTGGITAVPTVKVGGKKITPSVEALTEAVGS